jgi:hypothetical protein
MTTLQTPAARAIIYFCCIGGLLVLNGLIVMVLWNEVFLDVADAERRLSFLEGAGLTAFAYVGVFSVRPNVHPSTPMPNKGQPTSCVPDAPR